MLLSNSGVVFVWFFKFEIDRCSEACELGEEVLEGRQQQTEYEHRKVPKSAYAVHELSIPRHSTKVYAHDACTLNADSLTHASGG